MFCCSDLRKGVCSETEADLKGSFNATDPHASPRSTTYLLSLLLRTQGSRPATAKPLARAVSSAGWPIVAKWKARVPHRPALCKGSHPDHPLTKGARQPVTLES